ncbi:hypothetical protein M622_06840 [Thauera terpenica 58Eu]|jgi:hypothetical protein|uniref:ABC transporter n=1 Tax=Thauera terpenica 58Eu TaxID=1348657 RepID=T0AN48_9RHOO|nr:DUF808 domain-containing protein [Thauera terpenica]EPZ14289.1 hypothetical protein M622_06840 [Thauera terpenica 58Eu]MBP6727108.1 DUF808 domain-containing protein [Thauera sp.]MBP6760787.1 DUF808 domain-containing protein [Thauera sp.]
MAGTSLFLLLDDIASTLDDVATMTKIATRKTAGVLGDDLALNAEQVSGVRAERELPVVWAVAKGSMLNKLILVPAALAISALAPWLIGPLLMLGGAYLCFEGFEKLAHKYLPGEKNGAHRSKVMEALADPTIDLVAIEKNKIKGAVRTDFVLSAEIIVIALGVVGGLALSTQVAVLVSIAVMMTIGVYGLVAGIVKLDDLGLWLCRRANAIAHGVGGAILWAVPWLMRSLSVIGTAAMFLVGGGILSHGLPWVHHLIESLTSGFTGFAGALLPSALDGVVGLVVGALVLLLVSLVKRLFPGKAVAH